MTKEFIPYNQAVALKELGFDEKCFTWYWDDEVLHQGLELGNHNNQNRCVSAPLFQQAFRWFRGKHNLIRELYQNQGGYEWSIHIIVFNTGLEWVGYDDETQSQYKTYEEAELACLDKLIEIVKQEL